MNKPTLARPFSWSPPSRGAWIEIPTAACRGGRRSGSPPSRGAWIEIPRGGACASTQPSPPSRGAWIEITLYSRRRWRLGRRPPRGGRGLKCQTLYEALSNGRRPPRGGRGLKWATVGPDGKLQPSPPSRGAWIEIPWAPIRPPWLPCRPPRGGRGLKCLAGGWRARLRSVAPLAGGVD